MRDLARGEKVEETLLGKTIKRKQSNSDSAPKARGERRKESEEIQASGPLH